jgi:hypothetical protein
MVPPLKQKSREQPAAIPRLELSMAVAEFIINPLGMWKNEPYGKK